MFDVVCVYLAPDVFHKLISHDDYNRKQRNELITGCHVIPTQFNGSGYSCWILAGKDKYAGLRDGYLVQSNVCVFVVDYDVESTHNLTDYIKSCLQYASYDAKYHLIVTSTNNTELVEKFASKYIDSIKDILDTKITHQCISLDDTYNENERLHFFKSIT